MDKKFFTRGLMMAGVAALCMAAPSLHADGNKDWKGKKGDWMVERMKNALDLSDSQVDQVKDEMKKDKDASKAMHEKMTLDSDTLKLLLDKKASDSELTAALDNVKADAKAAAEARMNHMEAIAKILTPTQQAKAFFMMKHRGMRGGHGMGHPGGDGGE